jgi:transcription elongation factor GreA
VEGGDRDVASVGSRLVVEDETGSRLEVEISGVGGAGAVSPSSPLGSALLGKRVGDEVDVQAPRGSWRAKIVEISPELPAGG